MAGAVAGSPQPGPSCAYEGYGLTGQGGSGANPSIRGVTGSAGSRLSGPRDLAPGVATRPWSEDSGRWPQISSQSPVCDTGQGVHSGGSGDGRATGRVPCGWAAPSGGTGEVSGTPGMDLWTPDAPATGGHHRLSSPKWSTRVSAREGQNTDRATKGETGPGGPGEFLAGLNPLAVFDFTEDDEGGSEHEPCGSETVNAKTATESADGFTGTEWISSMLGAAWMAPHCAEEETPASRPRGMGRGKPTWFTRGATYGGDNETTESCDRGTPEHGDPPQLQLSGTQSRPGFESSSDRSTASRVSGTWTGITGYSSDSSDEGRDSPTTGKNTGPETAGEGVSKSLLEPHSPTQVAGPLAPGTQEPVELADIRHPRDGAEERPGDSSSGLPQQSTFPSPSCSQPLPLTPTPLVVPVHVHAPPLSPTDPSRHGVLPLARSGPPTGPASVIMSPTIDLVDSPPPSSPERSPIPTSVPPSPAPSPQFPLLSTVRTSALSPPSAPATSNHAGSSWRPRGQVSAPIFRPPVEQLPPAPVRPPAMRRATVYLSGAYGTPTPFPRRANPFCGFARGSVQARPLGPIGRPCRPPASSLIPPFRGPWHGTPRRPLVSLSAPARKHACPTCTCPVTSPTGAPLETQVQGHYQVLADAGFDGMYNEDEDNET